MTLCIVVEIYGCFKVDWCHHVQEERVLLIVAAVRTSGCAWNVLMAHTAVWWHGGSSIGFAASVAIHLFEYVLSFLYHRAGCVCDLFCYSWLV